MSFIPNYLTQTHTHTLWASAGGMGRERPKKWTERRVMKKWKREDEGRMQEREVGDGMKIIGLMQDLGY